MSDKGDNTAERVGLIRAYTKQSIKEVFGGDLSTDVEQDLLWLCDTLAKAEAERDALQEDVRELRECLAAATTF